MVVKTDDLKIRAIRPLIAPAVLSEEIPLTDSAAAVVDANRHAVENILEGDDPRLLVVVGPCSIHDPDAAREYAERLKPIAAADLAPAPNSWTRHSGNSSPT